MAALSRIRLWQASNNYIDLDYAQAELHYAEQGERIRDRLGLVHRIAPNSKRYPTGLTIRLLSEELTMMCNAVAPEQLAVLEWLEKYFRAQAQLVVYIEGETLAVGGTQISRRLGLKAYIEQPPKEFSGTLPVIGGGPEMVEIELLVTEDGEFSDFATLGSYTPYTPARP